MTESYTQPGGDGDTVARVREVMKDCLQRRAAGQLVDHKSLIARHPELAPLLAVELRKLDRIAAARHEALGKGDKAHSSSSQCSMGSGYLNVRCPSCHAPMEVAVDTPLTDLTCDVCGSHFSLVDQSKATRLAPSLSQLGRFELIERLGVGGFGSVWKARDNELDRTVAIKIPRQKAMSTEDQEKFFREARAAAQLRHPNIVSVHEVGRDGDSIFIVGDFVRGVTMEDWLTGQQFTNREAAELCILIAEALHHAHEKGIVHRDLKPANIMMDYDGQPHLMDFGLARREVGEVTVTVNGQILGTPAYMSPEQALGEGHTADRRSDVYSLGVILFQLLSGELPFRGNVRMLIKQVIQDDPPSPRKLNANIAADLETIVLKCMEKDPGRRYQTASEVADELRRFLTGLPIHARPLGALARGLRWCRRNPAVASLSAAVAVTLISGTAVATYYAVQAQSRARESQASLSRARAAVDESFTAISEFELISLPGFQPLRERLLGLAIASYEEFFDDLAKDDSMSREFAEMHLRLATMKLALGDNAAAKDLIARASKILERLTRNEPNNLEYRSGLARSALLQGTIDEQEGRYSAAVANYKQAISLCEQIVSDDRAENPFYQGDLASAFNQLANFQLYSDHPNDAALNYQQAIDVWEKLIRDNPEANLALQLAKVLANLAYLQLNSGSFDDAEPNFKRAITTWEKIIDNEQHSIAWHQELAITLQHYAMLQQLIGRVQDAEATYLRVERISTDLVRDNPSVIDYQNTLAINHGELGRLLQNAGRLGDAKVNFERAIELCNELIRKEPTRTDYQANLAIAYNNLSTIHSEEGDYKAAASSLQEAAKSYKVLTTSGPLNRGILEGRAITLTNLADLCSKTGEMEDAKSAAQEAHALWSQLIKDNAGNVGYRRGLAVLLQLLTKLNSRAGSTEDAITTGQQAVDILDVLSRETPANNTCRYDLAVAQMNLGLVFTEQSKREKEVAQLLQNSSAVSKAITNFRGSIHNWEKLCDVSDATEYQNNLASVVLYLAASHESVGELNEAQRNYFRAKKLYDTLVSTNPENDIYHRSRRLACSHLALIQQARGDSEFLSSWCACAQSCVKGTELEPDEPIRWYEACVSQLAAANNVEYTRLVKLMLERFGEGDGQAAELCIRACVIGPMTGEVAAAASQLTKLATASNENDKQALLEAAILFRTGKFQESIDVFETAQDLGQELSVLDRGILAMAHHAVGNVNMAGKWLTEAKQESTTEKYWVARIENSLVLAEAAKQIENNE